MRTPKPTTLFGAIAALAVVAGAPATASAGRLSFSGGAITYVAAPGETNEVNFRVQEEVSDVSVSDAVPFTIAPGTPCEPVDDAAALCKVTPSTAYRADLGDGNDKATMRTPRGTANALDGGAGDDELSIGVPAGRTTMLGGAGNDTLNVDVGEGGRPINPAARDVVSGGPGRDTLEWEKEYGGHVGPVAVSLDGRANDGGPSEGDNIGTDVEVLVGTRFADRFTGSNASETMTGSSGDDVLTGGGGNDKIDGGPGNDRLSGGSGRDFLQGGDDDDRITGGSGFDSFVGDFTGGQNQIVTGNDTIFARDGVQREPISCGPGTDRATVDTRDKVARDPQNGCETVKRPSKKRRRG